MGLWGGRSEAPATRGGVCVPSLLHLTETTGNVIVGAELPNLGPPKVVKMQFFDQLQSLIFYSNFVPITHFIYINILMTSIKLIGNP